MVAVIQERLGAVETLLATGAITTSLFPSGQTLLHAAAQLDKVTILQRLLDQRDGNLNLNAVDADGCTALMRAAEKEQKPCADALLAAGASTAGVSKKNGRTLLHAAAKMFRPKLLERLLARGDLEVNARDKDGHTPLMVATSANREGSVEALLKKGASTTIVAQAGSRRRLFWRDEFSQRCLLPNRMGRPCCTLLRG
eukprot:m.843237 g.843237  ORF g.843237 m.843237 type:complete len:198 (+) comp59532_c0_seq19:812-1405(+)